MEFRSGDSGDNTDVIGFPRKENNDVHRHDQEFYIYHVEGAGGPARIALQNVMGGNFLNNFGNGSSDGYVKAISYGAFVTAIHEQSMLTYISGIDCADITGMHRTLAFSESSSHSEHVHVALDNVT